MSKVRIGVVGAGHLGFHHIRILSSHPKAVLVGIYDIDQDRAKEVASTWNTKAYRDIESLLKDVEAVTCVVPTMVHYEVGKEILEEGKHLLLEKPMARTLYEAEELVSIARKKGVKFQVGHIERFNPAVLAVEKFIRNPKFAECHRLSPYSARGTDVDVVLDLMIHDLDLVLHFFKKEPVKVDAVGIPVLTDKADIATARITFEGGEIANITASRISSEKQRKLRFFQKNAYFSIDCLHKDVKAFIKDDDGILPLFPPIEKEMEPLFLELDSFLTSILEDKPPAVPAEEAYRALSLALWVTESLSEHLSEISAD
jgi:predicted dehydrogenase